MKCVKGGNCVSRKVGQSTPNVLHSYPIIWFPTDIWHLIDNSLHVLKHSRKYLSIDQLHVRLWSWFPSWIKLVWYLVKSCHRSTDELVIGVQIKFRSIISSIAIIANCDPTETLIHKVIWGHIAHPLASCHCVHYKSSMPQKNQCNDVPNPITAPHFIHPPLKSKACLTPCHIQSPSESLCNTFILWPNDQYASRRGCSWLASSSI